MKLLKVILSFFLMYVIFHGFLLFIFIMVPFHVEPEKIKSKEVLFSCLGEPQHNFEEKGFVAWEWHDGRLYYTVEYMMSGQIATSIIYILNNRQLFKKTKVWDGVVLYQCTLAWPYKRFCISSQ